ncbi:hypothetical protein CF641_37885, partial [Burkholderia pseudomallei]
MDCLDCWCGGASSLRPAAAYGTLSIWSGRLRRGVGSCRVGDACVLYARYVSPAGFLAPRHVKALGCQLGEHVTDMAGNVPNDAPEPAQPENVPDVIEKLKSTDAESGSAFDGDGVRLGVVTEDGQIIYPDRQL